MNVDEMAGSWRAMFQRMKAEPPSRAEPGCREIAPAVPFEARAVARIRLVRRVVAVPGSEAS